MAHNNATPQFHRLDRYAHKRLQELASIPDDKMLSTKAAAELIQTTESFLGLGRNAVHPYGPPFHRLSERSGYYLAGEIKSWLASRIRAFKKRRAL